MTSDDRCKSLTKRGERCRNKRRYGNLCYAHKKRAKKEQFDPKFAIVLGAISSFLSILDKIHEHFPSILGLLETISATTKCAGHRHREKTGKPSDELRGHYLSAPVEYGHILKSPRFSSMYEKIPSQFQGELEDSMAVLANAAESYFAEERHHSSKIYDSGRNLLDFMEKAEASAPGITSRIFSDLESLSGTWESLTIGDVRMSASVWRFSMLAEYREALLDTPGESESNVNVSLDVESSSPGVLLSVVPHEIKEGISEECAKIVVHSQCVEALGGEFPNYEDIT